VIKERREGDRRRGARSKKPAKRSGWAQREGKEGGRNGTPFSAFDPLPKPAKRRRQRKQQQKLRRGKEKKKKEVPAFESRRKRKKRKKGGSVLFSLAEKQKKRKGERGKPPLSRRLPEPFLSRKEGNNDL